jgi:HSP20 family protein
MHEKGATIMLMRFDPFRDIDRATDHLARQARSLLAMDAVRTENEVIIYIDVPGVVVDDIDVSVEKNELTVSVQRRWDDEGTQVLSSERPQGTFSRRIMLSDALDLDRLAAKTSDGVLTISIPVAERSKPRRIDVSSSGHDETVDTTSRDA